MAAETYTTTKPCKRGHIAPRFRSDNGCTVCKNLLRKARRKANPEKGRAESNAYRERHPDRVKARTAANADKQRVTTKAWRAANPERQAANSAAWARANPGRTQAAQAAWRKDNRDWSREYGNAWDKRNPDKVQAKNAARRGLRKRAPGMGVTSAQWKDTLADALGLCAYCNERQTLTMDHIEPLHSGGAHDVENVAAACLSCNASKSGTPLLVWLARQAGR